MGVQKAWSFQRILNWINKSDNFLTGRESREKNSMKVNTPG